MTNDNELEILESKCQLHQRVELLYVVGRYIATFLDQDGDREIAEAEGETMIEALRNLQNLPIVRDYHR